MSHCTGKPQQNGTEHNDDNESFFILIDVGLASLDKLQVAINNTTTLKDLKCNIEFVSGIPSDLFDLDHNGTTLVESVSSLLMDFEVSRGVVLKMRILPVWERFISTCLKPENSQVRARIRVKMNEVTKDERIFAACFVAARQANSCLLFGLLPCNKMITRRVRLSQRNILHAAIIGGDRNSIANILMNGGGKLINMEDVYGETPMSMAKTLNMGDIVDMLEAYEMISQRGEGYKKVEDDDVYGYECIIPRQNLGQPKTTAQQDDEKEHELSSDEEAQESSPEQGNCTRESNEMSSNFLPRSRHFLDGLAGNDGTTATVKESDVTERTNGASEAHLLIKQSGHYERDNEENGSQSHVDQTHGSKESAINGDNNKPLVESIFRSERAEEGKHVTNQRNVCAVNEQSLDVICRQKSDSNKSNKESIRTEVVKTMSEPEEKGKSVDDSGSINYCDELSSIKETEKMSCTSRLSENNSKIDFKINENQMEDVAMVTDEESNNSCVDRITNDMEKPIKKGSHPLNREVISNGEIQQETAASTRGEQPRHIDTGSPLVGGEIESTKPDGKLLPRRRKKGMPSLIVSRTSSGLSSSFETLDLLDPTGKTVNNMVTASQEVDVRLNASDEKQGNEGYKLDGVCAPPLFPKPPSSPVPIDKNRQQTRRRKFSTGSPTSGSPKSYSRSDMQFYVDEAWRRSSDSDVNESLTSPPARPRSYSTPHPPDPRKLTPYKTATPSNLDQFYNSSEISLESKIPSVPAINTSNRRQSVGGWVRKNSVAITFDEWLEAKREQHRRSSLTVQKEKERRLSLGNQLPSYRFSKNINYEQWLATKASVPERKTSTDIDNSCHGNERSRAESTRAFETWLQKKDEEALEREQKLLNEAISRKTRDTKREDLLTQLILKMENRKKSGGESTS